MLRVYDLALTTVNHHDAKLSYQLGMLGRLMRGTLAGANFTNLPHEWRFWWLYHLGLYSSCILLWPKGVYHLTPYCISHPRSKFYSHVFQLLHASSHWWFRESGGVDPCICPRMVPGWDFPTKSMEDPPVYGDSVIYPDGITSFTPPLPPQH